MASKTVEERLEWNFIIKPLLSGSLDADYISVLLDIITEK